jgi:hypothetical protein
MAQSKLDVRQHHADLPALPLPGAQPCGERLAVSPPDWLSNTVLENYDAIVDAACAAWRKLIAQPETITSIGMRDWVTSVGPYDPRL